jgi:hypothetical protein
MPMAAAEPDCGGTPVTLAHAGDPEPGSDVWLAGVLARAVADVPAVAALSAGHGAAAATHGPGKAVRGIALRHRADGGLAIEAHVEVAEADLESRLASLRADAGSADAEPHAVLPALAEEIRGHVACTLRAEAIDAPAAVDVYFDDLR